MLTIIAATSTNNALGKNNQLVWHLPEDFKRFKTITSGHYIIMGRKTFESFPKPLPNRTHVIITRNKNYQAPEGCLVVESLEDAIAICPKNEEVFVIGGGEIYQQSIHLVDKIEITKVHTTVDADTFFPEINEAEFEIVFEEHHAKDEKHQFDFTFLTYQKIKDI
jgi:dihydrofolate reductase